MARFVIQYRPGANWKTGRPWSEQGLYAHGEFMSTLFDERILLYGGPFDDHSGGLAVVEVESLDHVQAIIQSDPAVQAGVFNAEAHPWITVFDQPAGKTFFRKRESEKITAS